MFANTLMKMDASALCMSAFSPSKTCKVRVSSTRYRNDPYRARVAPYVKPVTPVFTGKKTVSKVAPATIVPIASAAPAAPSLPTLPPTPVKTAAAPTAPAKVKALAPSAAPLPTPAPKTVLKEEASSPLHKTASMKPKEHYALVGFKHETAMYQAPFRVAAGDIVVVEADRGEHIGVVQLITTTKPKYNVPCKVLRRASCAEAQMIDELTTKEARVTASVQKLAESFGLGIKIVDTEFQTDGNKLTIFFSSKVFVDFRKLQRSLFREFRCRIWLVNWNEVRTYTPVPVTMPQA